MGMLGRRGLVGKKNKLQVKEIYTAGYIQQREVLRDIDRKVRLHPQGAVAKARSVVQ